MKKLMTLLAILCLLSCSESKKDDEMTKKVICGDSVEQEFFDEKGESYLVKVPGKCDTIEVTEKK